MSIKRLAPTTCPHCGATKSLFIAEDGRLTCQLCGNKLATQTTPAVNAPPKKYPVTYGLTFRGELDAWARSAYESGLAYYERDDLPSAIAAFKRALDSERDFIDAHLWLGRLSEDAKDKLHHYGEVVATMPNHLEAIRELMVLKGDISREEADRANNTSNPNIQTMNAPVEAIVTDIECPVCGGEMRGKADGSAQCRNCNYKTPASQRGDYGMKSFAMEILKRRGQKVQWEVGERLLRCGSCGAETLLTSHALTANCPFCGSKNVLETDALRSFVRPDGILPFSTTEEEARERVSESLNSKIEKLKGFFVNNKVADVRVTGVYLPFWLYDVTVQISKTTQDTRTSFYEETKADQAYRHETFGDSAYDVPVCGVESPARDITERLHRYDLANLKPYHADMLAGQTAELYTLDFEKASLIARQQVSEGMRERHGHNQSDAIKISVQSMVQTMQFRLVLLPVWVFTLTERDGDVRVALAHGQREQVVLGSAVAGR
jgi:DNA-directed RNA polymerase subunit RPC12/RpoP